jgi:signal transduction histidine kinase
MVPLLILALLVCSPVPAWGYVPHEYPALYTHQFARIFLFVALLAVILYVIRNRLHTQRGWRYLFFSLISFAIWDLDVFLGRIAETITIPQTLGSTEGWQYFSRTINIEHMEYLYYIGRLDFVLLNIAMFFFYYGLKEHLREEEQGSSAAVLLPLLPIIAIDMTGNVLFIILAVMSVNVSLKLYRRDRENPLWHYMVWLSFSWFLYSISRSFGHILRHIMIPTGNSGLWKFFEPFTGSFNSLTLFFAGSVSLFFIGIYKSYVVIRGDKNALENLIQERTEFITQLERDKSELQELDKLKSAFLANISHELRTPMNSIIGYTELMLDKVDGPMNVEQEQSMQKVHENAKHLLKLIDDVLNIARIESGEMVLDAKEFDMNLLVRSVLSSFESRIQQKGLQLVMDLSEECTKVYGDEEKVKTILMNIVSNAVKFTHKGTITVTTSPYREHNKTEGATEFLDICVEDTGIGIKEDDFARIFDKFHQVDFTTIRQYEGTGLGLSIAQGIVSLHKGSLRATSRYGEGSRFCFTLPLEREVFERYR